MSVFQVHVLTFTVYQLLSVLIPTLKSGDLDSCMNMLIDVRCLFPITYPCRLPLLIRIPRRVYFANIYLPLLFSLPAFPAGQIFNNELFGAVAEEKEVKGIVSKLMEARHSKSMDSYELLARFCSKESITKLILPLKEVSRLQLVQVL